MLGPHLEKIKEFYKDLKDDVLQPFGYARKMPKALGSAFRAFMALPNASTFADLDAEIANLSERRESFEEHMVMNADEFGVAMARVADVIELQTPGFKKTLAIEWELYLKTGETHGKEETI